MQVRLDGKTAFVSGASSGIGRQCAYDLAEAGADVVVHGRDVERSEETAAKVREIGAKAVVAIGDLATLEGCESVARAALDGFGKIDICVNNCGVSLRQDNPRWDELEHSDWIDSVEVNFLASVRMSKAFYPGMKAQNWGRIIHISTLGALFQLNQTIVSGDTLYIRSHRPDGVPVEVKAQVVRLSAASHGTSRVGVSIVEQKESWLRLFVAWIADDNVTEGADE